MLKNWDSTYFISPSHGYRGADTHALKRDYYYRATQFIDSFDFHTPVDKEIWLLHADGMGVREISRILSSRMDLTLYQENFTKDKVWNTLKTLKPHFRRFLHTHNMTRDDLVAFRDKVETDEKFIYSTWLNNLYANTRWRRQIGKRQVWNYNKIIEFILQKPQVFIRVCCLKDDPDTILGYSVFELAPPDIILHWVFVRADWQRKRIATDLTPTTVSIITHMTKTGEKILKNKHDKWNDEELLSGVRIPRPTLILLPLSYEILENQSPISVPTPLERNQTNVT